MTTTGPTHESHQRSRGITHMPTAPTRRHADGGIFRSK